MDKYIFIGMSLCMLYVAIFALSFVYDVVKASWYSFKGKEMKWSFFTLFTDETNWKYILLKGIIFCVGIYGFFLTNSELIRAEYHEVEVRCNICENYFPEKYDTRDSWDTICPYCTNKEINNLLHLKTGICEVCGWQYDLLEGKHGMCWDCYLDISAECNLCGMPAPNECTDGDDLFLCTDCIGVLMTDKAVINAIRNYID